MWEFPLLIYNVGMIQVLTVSCKLQVPATLVGELDNTLKVFAEACEFIHANTPTHIHNRVRMQVMLYAEVRARFGLSANLTIQAIRRVSSNRKSALEAGSEVRKFRPTSVTYDARIFSFREQDLTVSLTLLHKRQRFHLSIGNYQRGLLKGQIPTSATLHKRRNGDYYIQIQIKPLTPESTKRNQVVGIDLGRRDIAHTSEGQSFCGGAIDKIRDQFAKVRASAQHKASKGTRSQRRRCRELLHRLSGREHRFQSWLNHTISHRLIKSALDGEYSLALEDLSGIRKRVKARGPEQRRRAHSWAFYQLRQFITYKALAAGVELSLVNPAYTSKTCHQCLWIGKRTAKLFACEHCGWSGDADFNGANNIALLGAVVNQPDGPGLFCPLFWEPRAFESSIYSSVGA